MSGGDFTCKRLAGAASNGLPYFLEKAGP